MYQNSFSTFLPSLAFCLLSPTRTTSSSLPGNCHFLVILCGLVMLEMSPHIYKACALQPRINNQKFFCFKRIKEVSVSSGKQMRLVFI